MLRASVQKRYDTPINMGESFKPGSMAAGQEKRERPFRLIGAVETLPSPDHPERNEDHSIYRPDDGVFGVADGIGGAPAGNFASEAAMAQLEKSVIEYHLRNAKDPVAHQEALIAANVFLADISHPQNEANVKRAGRAILKRMTQAIDRVGTLGDPAVVKSIYINAIKRQRERRYTSEESLLAEVTSEIGTTVTFGKLWQREDGKRFLTTFQLGDSAIFCFRKSRLEKLTKDHSYVQELVEKKLLTDEISYNEENKNNPGALDYVDLTVSVGDIRATFFENHPVRNFVKKLSDEASISVLDLRRMLTQTMNKYPMQAQIAKTETTETLDGDIYLALTDGITDNLTMNEIATIVELHTDNPEMIPLVLAHEAAQRAEEPLHHRAKRDDMTAVVIAVT